jgi:hypothetical protein
MKQNRKLRWYGYVMRIEDCRLEPTWKTRHGRPVNTWKDGIRDSMQSRKFRDGEYFDRELWRKKIVFGLRKIMYTQKNNNNK